MIRPRLRMQRIEVWQNEGWLTHAFQNAIGTYSNGTWHLMFNDIDAPIRDYDPQTGKPAEVPDWVQFGFTADEIAEAYWAWFGGNFFPDYYNSDDEFQASITLKTNRVVNLIHAVFRQNEMKYRKMIELAGFYYNPLWNVDGSEMFSSADAHGNEVEKSEFQTTSTHKVATYDGGDTATKVEYEDVSTSKPSDGNKLTRSHEGTNLPVSADDDAFKHVSGETVTGGIANSDFYHVEKRIRQGNIGTTSTQSLIAAERENLKFSILNEFFTDINEVVLIGLF